MEFGAIVLERVTIWIGDRDVLARKTVTIWMGDRDVLARKTVTIWMGDRDVLARKTVTIWMGDRDVLARLCVRPEIFQESNSVSDSPNVFRMRLKTDVLRVYTCAKRVHIYGS